MEVKHIENNITSSDRYITMEANRRTLIDNIKKSIKKVFETY